MAMPLELIDPDGYGGRISNHQERISAAKQVQQRAEQAKQQDQQRKAFVEQIYDGHKIPAPIAAEIVKNVAIIERARAEERLDIAHEMAGLPITPEKAIKSLTESGEMDKDLLEGKGSIESTKLDPQNPKAKEVVAMKRYIQFYYGPEFKGPNGTAEDMMIQNTDYKQAKLNLQSARDQEAEGAILSASTYKLIPEWERTIATAEQTLKDLAKPIEEAMLAPHKHRTDKIDERIADAEALFDYASNDMPCMTFGKAGMMRAAPNDCSVNDWMKHLDAVVEQGVYQEGVDDVKTKLKHEFVRHAQYMIKNELDYKKDADKVRFNDGRNYDPDEAYPTRQYGQYTNGLDKEAAANGLDGQTVATDATAEQTATATEGNAKWADRLGSSETQNNQMMV